MASTRTPGITTSIDGRRFIDKRYHSIRIGMRVGAVTQEVAELRLRALDLARRSNQHPLFRYCAACYLAQSRDKNSIETIRVHVATAPLSPRTLRFSSCSRSSDGAKDHRA